MIKGIKHIIFDLGGVILNIDYALTQQAFIEAGIPKIKELYSQMQQSTIFDDLETGKIDTAAFVEAIKKVAPAPVTDEKIIAAWNSLILDFPIRRLQILQQLSLHYNLFLLSNTNEIHETAFNDVLMRTCGFPNIGVFFDKVYLSHRVGLRKPMKEIFELVLNENNLRPEETLFIDDSPQHIEVAKSLGIQTIWLEKGMTIEDDVFRKVQ